MTTNKDTSSPPEEISNQVAEGKEKQVEGERKWTKVIQLMFFFSSFEEALRDDLKGKEM